MERIEIQIETGNAAFDESPTGEIASILRNIAADFEESGSTGTKIYDCNGNVCGYCRIIERD